MTDTALFAAGMTITLGWATNARALEDYSCCGNKESAISAKCRYTDRGETCTYDGDCTGGEYGACCPQGCTRLEDMN